MNPAYRHARFRAELPHGGLPESFAVITACNPRGQVLNNSENACRTRRFEEILRSLGRPYFPVTGYDAGSRHEEQGFGIFCDQEAAHALGIGQEQEEIFRVYRGRVELESCLSQREAESLSAWANMADPPPPRFHFRGPFTLLDQPAKAFLCGTQCPGEKILEAYEWARRQCDQGGTVISGFHTPVEKDVLAILARRGAKIVWVPARDLPKATPKELQIAEYENRLLILTPFSYGVQPRPTKQSSSIRNRFVLGLTPNRYILHVADDSSLSKDIEFMRADRS